jgi:hypothetical protein
MLKNLLKHLADKICIIFMEQTKLVETFRGLTKMKISYNIEIGDLVSNSKGKVKTVVNRNFQISKNKINFSKAKRKKYFVFVP